MVYMTVEGMNHNWRVTVNYVLLHPWDLIKQLLKNNL